MQPGPIALRAGPGFEEESLETQVWLDFAVSCGYLEVNEQERLSKIYASIIGTLVGMITHADKWTIKKR